VTDQHTGIQGFQVQEQAKARDDRTQGGPELDEGMWCVHSPCPFHQGSSRMQCNFALLRPLSIPARGGCLSDLSMWTSPRFSIVWICRARARTSDAGSSGAGGGLRREKSPAAQVLRLRTGHHPLRPPSIFSGGPGTRSGRLGLKPLGLHIRADLLFMPPFTTDGYSPPCSGASSLLHQRRPSRMHWLCAASLCRVFIVCSPSFLSKLAAAARAVGNILYAQGHH